MASLGDVFTFSLPCHECRRPPLLRVPVEWERRGLTIHGYIDVGQVRLAVNVHAKQHA